MLWKDRQNADHRTTYPGNALQLDMAVTRRPILSCRYRPSEHARARYEDSFTRFCALFPDRFYVSERGRMFLTNARDIASDAEGHRLLSAGFHSLTGYFRDDRPLYDLVLDVAQQRRAGSPLAGARRHHPRPCGSTSSFIWFERADSPSFMATAQFDLFAPRTRTARPQAKIKQLAEAYLAKARAWPSDVALQAIQDHFNDDVGEHPRAWKQAQGGRRAQASRSPAGVRRRAYRRPLTKAESDDLLAFYRIAARAGRFEPRGGDPRRA